LDVDSLQLLAETSANLGLLVILETQDGEVFRVIVGGVFIDVMDLDRQSGLIADTTSSIVFEKHTR
jgi:hypothetical protein